MQKQAACVSLDVYLGDDSGNCTPELEAVRANFATEVVIYRDGEKCIFGGEYSEDEGKINTNVL